MPHAVVLGGGLVGSLMAADMASDPNYSVTLVDRDPDHLAKAAERAELIAQTDITTTQADLTDLTQLHRAIEPADIVLGALASPIGFQTMKAIIEAKKNFADICFMPEDAIDLDPLARQHNVTVVPDMGVAPGMSNLFAGYAAAHFETCTNIEIYVGGLPKERRWPFEYKAGFSPYDVVEEYTRPSRIVENGTIVIREALTEPELMNLPVVGTVEAFNTDGLRSIATTLDVPNMKEKTLRYPGHIELMRVFRETGLFSHDPIDINGHPVKPIDVIQKLMFPMWEYGPGEADLTVMRVIAQGTNNGKDIVQVWDLYDEYDPATQASSMARTTAFPCTIAARMIADGTIAEPGVLVPELLGKNADHVTHFLTELGKRGVQYAVNQQ